MHDFLVAVVSFVIVLGIMVVVHEFGHFAVAKLCGVRVEVFSVGFGPRLFGYKRGDTDYRVSALPLGGYVKMSGENPAETQTEAWDFGAHPRWQRILIGLAGPVANFLLALALMTGYGMLHNEVPLYYSQPVTLDWVTPGSQAAAAGLEPGDRIAQFDQTLNPDWTQMRLRAQVNRTNTVTVVVDRNGKRIATSLLLADKTRGQDFDLDSVGIYPVEQSALLQVARVADKTPAAQAGIKPGDIFLTVDGHAFHGVPALRAYLEQTHGRPLAITIQRGATVIPLAITPAPMPDEHGDPGWRLGFNQVEPPVLVEQLPFFEAVKKSVQFNRDNSLLILEVLQRIATRRMSPDSLAGPVGMARMTGEAAESKQLQPMIGLMTVISLNLGIFNLLPIPILDGGLILMLLIESLIRRDISLNIKERVYQVAFVALVLFAAFVIFNDVTKISFHPHP